MIQKMHKPIQRTILLNPGPVTTTDNVKQSLMVSDICHRESEFTQMLQGIRQDLLKIVNAERDYTTVLFTSSGTGAIESCISSVVSKNKKLAVINNGAYGQRIVDIARRYHITVVEINFPYDKPIDLSYIESALVADSDIHYLAMVHHETSIGFLNPLGAVGELCYRLGRGFIVDAMSSFAATDIDVKRDHIDFIISSSNKCLQGMPGISFVICNKQYLMKTEGNARSYYFDLHQQYHALEKTGQMPFTPAVQVVYSLRQALDELFIESVVGRIQRYHENYLTLINGLLSLGFRIITPTSRESKLLATVRFPEKAARYEFDRLHDYLYEKGYTIYPKKLAINHTFRVACMGHLDKVDIHHFLKELKNYLNSIVPQQKDLA